MASHDRVVIITGGAKGIGAACARRFARDGARVIVADVDEEAGPLTADEIQARGGKARFVSCDVSDRLDVKNMLTATLNTFDRVDVLINNAGAAMKGDILTLDPEDWDRALQVNLYGAYYCARLAAKQMVKQIEEAADRVSEADRNYCIINMSSVNAVVSIPDQLAYSASKGALNQFTKSMALALAPHGIRVNAVGPGSISTDVLKAVIEDRKARKRVLSRTPMGRIGDPDEVAGVAAFLASRDASYMTGECVYVDGGRLALNYTVNGT